MIDAKPIEKPEHRMPTFGPIGPTAIVPISCLELAPAYPRVSDDPFVLQDLMESLQSHGMLQPIVVRAHPITPEKLIIQAGGRRWQAATFAGLTHVPVVHYVGTETELCFLVENCFREDLHPIVRAREVSRLSDVWRLNQIELATRLCMKRADVATDLAIARIPRSILDEALLLGAKISRNHLVEIAQSEMAEQQLLWDKAKAGATRDELRLAKQSARREAAPALGKLLASSLTATTRIVTALGKLGATRITEADVGTLSDLKAKVTAIASLIADLEQMLAPIDDDHARAA